MSYGSLRRCDCREAEIVLTMGVYLTFRLERDAKPVQQNLVEVSRRRMGVPQGIAIAVPEALLQRTRREAFRAIMAHRAAMRLPDTSYRRPVQLRFTYA